MWRMPTHRQAERSQYLHKVNAVLLAGAEQQEVINQAHQHLQIGDIASRGSTSVVCSHAVRHFTVRQEVGELCSFHGTIVEVAQQR